MIRIIACILLLTTATGCAGSTWHLGEDGLTVTNARTGQTAVLTGTSKTADGKTIHDPHAGVPGCSEWLHAQRVNTPGAWGDAWAAYREAVREAYRRKRAASGSYRGVMDRAEGAFGGLE